MAQLSYTNKAVYAGAILAGVLIGTYILDSGSSGFQPPAGSPFKPKQCQALVDDYVFSHVTLYPISGKVAVGCCAKAYPQVPVKDLRIGIGYTKSLKKVSACFHYHGSYNKALGPPIYGTPDCCMGNDYHLINTINYGGSAVGAFST